MGTHFIGLDAHCKSSDLKAVTMSGHVSHRWQGPTTIPALTAAIEQVPRPRRLAVEEGAISDWLWRNLSPVVDEFIVSEPRRNHLIANDGEKDDPLDAEKLAQLLRGGYLKPVYHSESLERTAFKQHVALYHNRVAARVAQANEIMGYVRGFGVFIQEKDFAEEAGREEVLARLPELKLVRFNMTLFFESYALAVKLVDKSRRRLIQIARREPQIRRFTALPGISWIRAATFFAYIDTPWRFKSKSALWKYMGIGLERYRSGSGPGQLHVTRRANRVLKGMILGAAQSAVAAGDNPFADQYRRWTDQSIAPRNARRNVARSQAATLWGMWKSDSEYRAEWVGLAMASTVSSSPDNRGSGEEWSS